MATFGERLKQLRVQNGKTLRECAELFEVQLRSYQRYESNESTPKYELLLFMAEYYNVSLDWLTGRSDNPDIH